MRKKRACPEEPREHSSMRRRKGFTLIELLTVIAIIGILASIVVVAVNEPRKRARDTKRMSDLKSIKTALEMYYEQNQKFPITGRAGVAGVDIQNRPRAAGTCIDPNWLESSCSGEWDLNTCTTAAPPSCLNFFIKSYLSPLSKDPLNGKTGVNVVSGASCAKLGYSNPMAYWYKSTSNGQGFKVMSKLETMCDGNNDGGTSGVISPRYDWYEVWGGDGGQSL